MFLTLIVCIFWCYNIGLIFLGRQIERQWHFISPWKWCKKTWEYKRIWRCESNWTEIISLSAKWRGKSSLIFFLLWIFSLHIFPLSILLLLFFFFSGYIIVEHIQDDCMNIISGSSMKYFHFFALILWRAWEEWEVSFCKTWNLQWVLIYKILINNWLY